MADQEGQSNQLKHGAISGIALVFLVIAAAAPLGASATNTPLIFMRHSISLSLASFC